jgi:hypothetical protein
MTRHENNVHRSLAGLCHLKFVISSSFEVRHSSFHRCCVLLVSAGLLALSGASCPQTLQRYTNPPPRVLPPSPTLQQVIEKINQNSSQIQSFYTTRASISGRGFPSLPASVAFQRARRFRLMAGTAMLGTEVDLGSNDELFWVWLRRSQPPAMYYCRHDQFATSPARQTMPFEPGWLIEALGVTEFDPALPHQGPIQLPGDRLRIDTIRNTPDGPVTKVTIIDGSQAWVLEQHIFDARRQLLASSVASGHRCDPLSNLVMPTVVDINCPPAQLTMRINLGNVEINRLSGDRPTLWTMPTYPGVQFVDMANPPAAPPPAPTSAQRPPPPANWQRPTR